MAPIALTPPESSPERSNISALKKQAQGIVSSAVNGVSTGSATAPVDEYVELNDGNRIPQVALGVYKAPNGQETEDAVTFALDAGYRHIDSAARYANEEACGRAINAWLKRTNTRREEVFVTSKLWDEDHGYERTWKALLDSLHKFGLDYLDLYLIHSPSDCDVKRYDSWRAMEDAQRARIVKSIGVSNFGESHMLQILEKGTVKPAVNQIEVHPFCPRQDLVDLCKINGVKIEAYSPLVRGNKLEDERIVAIAKTYNREPAQILLNWNAVHKGNVVLPKSMTPSRIRSNSQVFDFVLDAGDLATLDSMGEENYVTGSLHKSN